MECEHASIYFFSTMWTHYIELNQTQQYDKGFFYKKTIDVVWIQTKSAVPQLINKTSGRCASQGT